MPSILHRLTFRGIAVTLLSCVQSDTLLNGWPMVMSHDAATGYMKESGVIDNISKNQRGTFREQLDCGARALEVRPQCEDDGTVIMHHGIIDIEFPLQEALAEVIDWATDHPDEFVVVSLSHYEPNEESCRSRVQEVLQSLHLMTSIGSDGSCESLAGLIIEKAKEMSFLEGGGHVFTIEGEGRCIQANYVDSLTCYKQNWKSFGGFDSCHEDGSGQEKINGELNAYIRTIGSRPPPKDQLVINQAHWQYDGASSFYMYLKRSSILEDVEQSGINKRVARMIPELAHVNLISVDNVCHHGEDIRIACTAFINNISSIHRTYSSPLVI